MSDAKAREAARNKQYYADHKEAERARCRAYHAANRERRLAVKAAYRAVHREEHNAKARERMRSSPELRKLFALKYGGRYRESQKAWTARNREHVKKVTAEWTRKNRSSVTAKVAKRRATKIRATPSWADVDAIRAIYDSAAAISMETGIPHEVDHIYPLQGRYVCGLHVACNLQILTQHENRRKHNSLPASVAA